MRTRALPANELHLWTCRVARQSFVLDVLGLYCGHALAEGDLQRTALGKPFMPAEPIEFSVSHSAGRTVMAVSRHGVGIDVERIAPLPELEALAGYCLAAEEARQMAALEAPRRTEFFYRCWTRKEAFLKAAGVGLTVEPRTVDTLGTGRPWDWCEPSTDPGWALAVACSRKVRIVDMGEAP